jgi:glycolate oxidase FAD binding subunit
MTVLTPQTPEELAQALGASALRRQTITLEGRSTKRLMAGPVEPADVALSTRCLNRVLQYEPRDLTISVEAGLPYGELSRLLAENGQMVPLDPPFAEQATVGGVIASNASGPRRRLYGTARDLVIGMRFATLEGKLVQSGGMVVKNVAGLDMGKLMIGSFGTLAAIAVVNFKLAPRPSHERSFLLSFQKAAEAVAARNAILKSALQPAALDLLNPDASAGLGNRGWVLAVQAGGNSAAVDRYERELASMGDGVALEGAEQASLWRYIQEFTPRFLDARRDGAVVRVSCTLKDLAAVVDSTGVPLLARAGSGVCYAYFQHPEGAVEWTGIAVGRGWRPVIEFSPQEQKHRLDLWPAAASDLKTMERVKHMFDPHGLLNRGRLYRRI